MATLSSLQSGSESFTTVPHTVTITSVTTANSILFATYTMDSVVTAQFAIRCELTDSTTLTFDRNTATGTVSVSWFVVEFSAGVTVQRGLNTALTSTTNDTITAVTLSQSFSTLSNEAPGSSYGDDDMFTHQLTTTENFQTVSQKAPAAGVGRNWQVIDFDDLSTQRGVDTMTGASLSQTITALTDISKAFCLVSPRLTSSDSLVEPDQGSITAEITTTTNLEITRTGSTSSLEVGWQIMEFTGADTLQKNTASFGTGDTVDNITITAVDLTKCVAFCAGYSTQGSSAFSSDDNYGTARVIAELTSTTNLRLTRALTGTAALQIRWFVLEFGGGTPPTGFAHSSIAAIIGG